jgi:ATP-dependent Lon protease
MSDPEVPRILPLLALRDACLFPGAILPIELGRPLSIEAVQSATQISAIDPSHDRIVVAIQRSGVVERPSLDDLYPVGVLAQVAQVLHGLPGRVTVVVHGLRRVNLLGVRDQSAVQMVEVSASDEPLGDPSMAQAMAATLRDLIRRFSGYQQSDDKGRRETFSAILQERSPGRVADLVAALLSVEFEKKVAFLQEKHAGERLRRVLETLTQEINVLDVRRDIEKTVREHMHQHEHEVFLRHTARAIEAELGEEDFDDDEEWLEDLRERLDEKELPELARQAAERELRRLSEMNPQGTEADIARTYVEWILDLPWHTSAGTTEVLDLAKARATLDRDHFGLRKAKARVLEFLAIRKLNPKSQGPILCLAGPPGVGKTSLARSIAETLNRPFTRISLGGLRDEAEIRGHRRAYVGALPGRLVQAMKKVKTTQPLILLDEIDKMTNDETRGDPASALLEALDAEQNQGFEDHYLDVPYDLSQVVFVCTANDLHAIPPVLRDRLEIIELSGYTIEEKVTIARNYLVPREKSEHGLKDYAFDLPDDTIRILATEFTRESGVRDLGRQLAALLRDAAMRMADNIPLPEVWDRAHCETVLGPPRYHEEIMASSPKAGLVAGLAWTPSGGRILFVETTVSAGDGKIRLTGKQGEVMRESGQAALSVLRARLADFGLREDLLERTDIHVHLPSGAVPKDGPSAGITMAVGILSAMLGEAVRNDIAMTGEVTLTGKVLPIGGLREKLLAAHRAGIREVIIPSKNRKDEPDLPDALRSEMKLHYVDHLDQVIDLAFVRPNHIRVRTRTKAFAC